MKRHFGRKQEPEDLPGAELTGAGYFTPSRPSLKGRRTMEQTVAVIEKNRVEEIRIGLSQYQGHNLVSVRVWADPYAGEERIPTKKGITLAVTRLPELIAGLQAAEAAAREAGLIEDAA